MNIDEEIFCNGVDQYLQMHRDADIKNLSIPKREFLSALKKVSRRNGEPKPSPVQSISIHRQRKMRLCIILRIAFALGIIL